MYQHHLDPKLKKRALHRARIIKGQMEGLIKAVEQEVYCTHLLEQSLAIQKSLISLDAYMLENHLRTHVKHQLHGGEEDKAVKELIKIYKLSNK
jgi:CsoR family transcriptional regulator, copper-sensing transcriptional repressor